MEFGSVNLSIEVTSALEENANPSRVWPIIQIKPIKNSGRRGLDEILLCAYLNRWCAQVLRLVPRGHLMNQFSVTNRKVS